MLAVVDGREFERLSLDVNLVPGDPRPTEPLTLRSMFEFAGLDPVVVPAISPGQQLAEKLHACTRHYGETSSRAKDLCDMLILADGIALPTADGLADVCRESFELGQTPWPPDIRPPPVSWAGAWQGFVATYGPRWAGLDDAFAALEHFWRPVLDLPPKRAWWKAERWRWE